VKQRWQLVFLLVFSLFLFFSPQEALAASCDYVVNDVAGLRRAKSEIRNINNNMTKDIVVCLKGGNYYLDNTISFTPEDSGSNGHKVVYQNSPGKTPVLIGGQPITNWQQHSGNIYKANVGNWKFYNLMENSVPSTMARFPNSGYLRVESEVTSSITKPPNEFVFTYAARDFAPLGGSFEYGDAKIYIREAGSPNGEYNGEVIQILDIDWSRREITVRKNIGHGKWFPINEHAPYYVRGSLNFLDAPGEYYLDESEGILYYWPRKLPIASQVIVAPKVDRIIEVTGGSVNNRVKQLRFKGLTLKLTDSADVLWHDDVTKIYSNSALLYMENVENITVENCHLQNAGVDGIVAGMYAQKIVIKGNTIENVGRVGILLRGVEKGANDGRDLNNNNTVSNNYLKNGYLEYADGSLLWLGHRNRIGAIAIVNSGSNKIVHNKIIHWPYIGIALQYIHYTNMQRERPCPDCWNYLHTKHNYIGFNEVSQVMENSNDGGGIYTGGGGRYNILDNNLVHDIHSNSYLQMSNGIYLDDHSYEWTVKNNVVYNIGGTYGETMTVKGVNNTIVNNIFADNEARRYGKPIDLFVAGTDTENLTVTKNIFYREGGRFFYYMYPSWRKSLIKEMDNNLFYYPSRGDYRVRLGHRSDDILLADWKEMGYDRNSIIADPKFVGQRPVDRAKNGYRLQNDSPALALGFEQIDTSKIGLCGQPWNDKEGCYSGPSQPSLKEVIQGYGDGNNNLDLNSDNIVNGIDFGEFLI